MLRAGQDAVDALLRLRTGQPADELLDSASRRLRQTDDAELARRMELGWCVGGVFFESERSPAAQEVFGRMLRLANGTRQEHLLTQCNIMLALTSLWMLELDSALAHAEAAEEVAWLQHVEHQIARALTTQALVLLQRGERSEAERAAAESEAINVRLEPSMFISSSHARNATVLWADDPQRLLRELEAMPELHRRIASIVLCELVDAAIAAGRHEDAQRWTQPIAERAERLHLPLTAARAGRCQAALLLARNEPLAAAEMALATAQQAPAGSQTSRSPGRCSSP